MLMHNRKNQLISALFALWSFAIAGLPPSDAADNRVLWRQPFSVGSGPIAAGQDYLAVGVSDFLGDSSTLSGDACLMFALRKHDGAPQGYLRHTNLLRAGQHQHLAGMRTRPVVEGNRIYYYSNRGEIVCAQVTDEDGQQDMTNSERELQVIWSVDCQRTFGVVKMDGDGAGSPLPSVVVDEHRVYCITGNGCRFLANPTGATSFVPEPKAASFVALDKRSGDVCWTSSAPGEALVYSWSTPVLLPESDHRCVAFPGGDGVLYIFERHSGTLVSQLDCNSALDSQWSNVQRGTRCFFVAPPTYHDHALYFGLNQDVEAGGVASPIQRVDIPIDPMVSMLSSVWKITPKGYRGTFSPILVNGDYVFALSEHAGCLYALDRTTGAVVGSQLFDEYMEFDFCALQCDGRDLYVTTDQALYVVLAGAELKVKRRIPIEGQFAGPPFISEEVIILPLRGKLVAIAHSDE